MFKVEANSLAEYSDARRGQVREGALATGATVFCGGANDSDSPQSLNVMVDL
jgi:hypothetical protein